MEVEFVHQCDVPNVDPKKRPTRRKAGDRVPAAEIPAAWLEGALAEGFCREVATIVTPDEAAGEQ